MELRAKERTTSLLHSDRYSRPLAVASSDVKETMFLVESKSSLLFSEVTADPILSQLNPGTVSHSVFMPFFFNEPK